MNPPATSQNEGTEVSDIHNGKHFIKKPMASEDGAGRWESDTNSHSFKESEEKSPEQDIESCCASEKTTKPVPDQASSPRNAWGNSSYADLITQAILSSPNKKMTLQEIYAWISDNIPYFMDKKDGPTTTGWKNSVRHTLSIRKRFVRLRNTDYGSINYKSYWTIDQNEETRNKTSSRGRRSESHPYFTYSNMTQNPHIVNDTRMYDMRNGIIYDGLKLQAPGSCCPFCEWYSSLSVGLPYQHAPSYYGYSFK